MESYDEREWLVSMDAKRMLEMVVVFARWNAQPFVGFAEPILKTDRRKLTMFVKACVDRGQCEKADIDHWKQWIKGEGIYGSLINAGILDELQAAQWFAGLNKHENSYLLREIFGNPFSPVEIREEIPCWLSWRDNTIWKLAQEIEASHSWFSMPILADALEEAWCEVEAIVSHCRSKCPFCGGLKKMFIKRRSIYHAAALAHFDKHFDSAHDSLANIDHYDHYNVCPLCQGRDGGHHCDGCWVIDLLLNR